ncbi:MAG: M14 family metallopeptidase [Acidobacteria bacterium]|nr:M14 family metallopeptidase [Acidobacteriota bacterium]
MTKAFRLIIGVLLSVISIAAQTPDLPRTGAELSNFEETSRYDEVSLFIAGLQKRAPNLRVENFGESQEGRKLPMMILSDRAVSTPAEARALGRPVIFVMGNIHAGEVEGKEAALVIARRLLFGDLRPLLSKLTILIAPIYNADGNEKISTDNRTNQNGPIGGVGARENAQKLDLNRDYMKLDSPEARALVGVFNRWDPHLTVDLHTTNGSYHGYHLTYSQPLNPNTDQAILDFQRNRMMPAIAASLLKNFKFRSYYYGNFTGFSNTPKEGAKTTWEAFTHQPRIGQNYGGLRNRLTILSEAYSYVSFKRRVEVTERFVEEILKYSAANAVAIRSLTKAADDRTVAGLAGKGLAFGVEFKPKALPKPVDILVGEVEKIKNPRSGKEMTAMIEDKYKPLRMEDLGIFEAVRSVAAPKAYLIKADKAIVDKLRQHGIQVEELSAELETEVEAFTVERFEKYKRPFQGHNAMTVKGSYATETVKLPAGTIVVRTAQPLGRLAFYLLEPTSDDGLVVWNFFDATLESAKAVPIFKLMRDVNLPTRIVKN